ncbi:hypothetical protein LXA47_17410 [Massilia sp. P8910]|uniref:Fucose-specific lectin n=1 Tax=Massilia antarctica TaxID=2765360 RepID=A0AA49A5V4_9BURK|nr:MULTISPECIES: hypothetical protein [Massilia]CUI08591.1 hypothetical protein BN2497_11959 [Janthinobacterium sp. CG23_2]MCE3605366.1 hypothetical protein [Massilia antarctica]MCY0914188.1 hypothetical protein [Massilia sp. H27-R4]QPI47674.1 hypothetical protein IV454_19005 [Massilia antarctica]CUU32377.1 hypothetical protein BN3177_11959 [Janthinobacterium sp. CG23_2]
MSNPLLVAVANATQYAATLTSTNNSPKDNSQFSLFSTGFTGGTDKDNIKIPQCSGPQWYEGHHILITGQDANGVVMWTVSLWSNDQNNAVLYWNNTDGYSENNPLPGTGGGQVISTLFIGFDPSGNLFVHANSY